MAEQETVAENVASQSLVDSLDTAIPTLPIETDALPPTTTESQEPNKFKDKSREDIIQSYSELEKSFGRQGGELGELRKITDQWKHNQDELQQYNSPPYATNTTENESNQPNESETYDYLTEPEKAMQQQINKAMAPMNAELNELRSEKLGAKLQQSHPDYQTVVKDTKFQEWVAQSPMRVEMFSRADTNYDYDSANELFSSWKATQTTSSHKEANPATEQAFKDAALETNNTLPEGSQTSKKLYRRADIIELKMKNPQRYAALANEITLAYQEGRVRD